MIPPSEENIVTCAELEAQKATYLATNVTCTEKWYNILRKYSFATEGVGLATVAFVGILANLLSIAILCKRTMKTQISALLITLGNTYRVTQIKICEFELLQLFKSDTFFNFDLVFGKTKCIWEA